METMEATLPGVISPIDRQTLKAQVRVAQPVPHFCIDDFLDADFANRVADALPNLDQARKVGKGFQAVNERGKIQVTDSSQFAPPVRELHEALASQAWLEFLGDVMGIPHLLADPELVGGGIHITGPRGHLDVHVDFNYIEERQLHRRLNILVYFNRDWAEGWGGNIELWDKEVKHYLHSYAPKFNRCVVFETNEISFHGVTAVKCPPSQMRRSFAAYYYTREAPAGWDGTKHSTIFKARPDEKVKGMLLMPLERVRDALNRRLRGVKDKIRGRA